MMRSDRLFIKIDIYQWTTKPGKRKQIAEKMQNELPELRRKA